MEYFEIKFNPQRMKKERMLEKTDQINIFTDLSEYLILPGNPGNPRSNKIELNFLSVIYLLCPLLLGSCHLTNNEQLFYHFKNFKNGVQNSFNQLYISNIQGM